MKYARNPCAAFLHGTAAYKFGCMLTVLFLSSSCNSGKTEEAAVIPVISKILSDTSSRFYTDFNKYPKEKKPLAIGIFDSGTGGLTVLEKFLVCDAYDNLTGEMRSDGIPDFVNENFNYLGDMANMPYGHYPQENKTGYLRELIIKDALFLLKEKPSKIIVVACNTATAYGLDDITALLEKSGTAIRVIGVINAGVNATLLPLDRNDDYAIGVLATAGTIASNAYEKTILKMKEALGFKGNITVVNQAGTGLAEAIDGATPAKPTGDSLPYVQLNSPEDYARFHLVSLIEKYRLSGNTVPIKRIILGCTHYPYLLHTFNEVISELRNYTRNGEYIYKNLIAGDFEFIDPAFFTAKECYEALKSDGLLSRQPAKGKVYAYVSIPAPDLTNDKLNDDGSLSDDFKYGRNAGTEDISTIVAPFSPRYIDEGVLQRLEKFVPYAYRAMQETNRNAGFPAAAYRRSGYSGASGRRNHPSGTAVINSVKNSLNTAIPRTGNSAFVAGNKGFVAGNESFVANSGKTLHYALRWENIGGEKGLWSAIRSAMFPQKPLDPQREKKDLLIYGFTDYER
jgi:glutamate racemase